MLLALFLTCIATVESGQESQARFQSRLLEQAVKAYYGMKGTWPRQLADVAPMLENGKKDLLNPWGIPYQFVLAEVKDGVVRPFIWTSREVNGKERVYGMMPPAPQKK